MTTFLRQLARRWRGVRRVRLVRLNLVARTTGHQDLRPILMAGDPAWSDRLSAAKAGPRVLIATNLGGHFGLAGIDRLLAAALTLRGAHVTTVLCDSALPACQMCEHDLLPVPAAFAARGPNPDLCSYCHAPADRAAQQLGLSVERIGALLTSEDRREADAIAAAVPLDQLKSFTWRGLPLGEHAEAGALRYYARSEIDAEPASAAVTRRYLSASILTALAYDRLIERVAPDVVVAHHGIYVPQGIVAAVARARGVRVVTWNPAYRRHCFIFSHHDTYHHTMMTEPVEIWRDRALSPAEDERIRTYLESRWHGTADWIRFHTEPEIARDFTALGLDPQKPTVLALTNVFWDAQLHYPTNAFRTQRDWLLKTIEWFARRPDLQLVVRIHPAEVVATPASRQRAADEIAAAFPVLPGNVRLVPPESRASTYALAALSNCAIIFATKTGVELTSVGIPVIVAGEAWIRNKGLTLDAASEEDYLRLLERLPFAERLDDSTITLARRYANHFFFGRMIPLEFVEPAGGPRRFTVAARDRAVLEPGGSVGLDVICRGILEGTPFVMPPGAET